jgi:hypothetical protein
MNVEVSFFPANVNAQKRLNPIGRYSGCEISGVKIPINYNWNAALNSAISTAINRKWNCLNRQPHEIA